MPLPPSALLCSPSDVHRAQFAEDKYNLDMSGGNLFQLNRAITTGAEQGVFSLPKGPSGKIKLAPKRPRTAAATEMKEVR